MFKQAIGILILALIYCFHGLKHYSYSSLSIIFVGILYLFLIHVDAELSQLKIQLDRKQNLKALAR